MKKLSCLFVLLIFNGCSINPVTGQQDFVMMSENQEISLGKKYHAQVLQQTPAYDDQELQNYVQRIGNSLSIKSHRPNLFYRLPCSTVQTSMLLLYQEVTSTSTEV